MSWGPPSDQPERPSDRPGEGEFLPPYEGREEQQTWGPPQPAGGGQQPWGDQEQWGRPSPPPGGGRTPGKATAALVLGILGLIVCPIVCSVLALVFGYQSRNEIDSDPMLGGRGLATAGIVLGWIGIALMILVFIYFVAVGATG